MSEKVLKQKNEAGAQPADEIIPADDGARGVAATVAQNSLIGVGRRFVTAAVNFVLPAYLTHKLSIETYSAWVLILQLGAYVSYLDFGVQFGISKYVAEYEARKDTVAASTHASAGLALMLVTSTLGVGLTLVLAWQAPMLFHGIPTALYHDLRIGIIFVGISLSFGLLSSIFPAIFFGLQRYAVPAFLLLINRLLYAAVVVASVAFHQGLVVMSALVAAVNIITGLLQFGTWRRWASNIQLSLRRLDRSLVWKISGYCSSLAIWTLGMLCVNGLDVAIVGKYDFGEIAFYSIATLPTNFAVAILGEALAPLLPSVSALSVLRSPRELGAILARTTRYTSIFLLLSGLPLIVAGYWVLYVWLGATYALHTIGYLRILLLANILRCTCAPYSNMLVATNSQRVAIAGVIAEATTNVACSIYLAAHLGAIGVAYGTLIGSIVSVGMHFTWNMHYTMEKFTISRFRLFFTGLARPAVIALPSLFLIPFWWSSSVPAFNQEIWFGWGMSTLVLAWFVGLSTEERSALMGLASRWVKARNIL